MPSKQPTQSHGGFLFTIVFILSIVVLVLLFVLLTRDQGTKTIEDKLNDLVQSNVSLQETQNKESQKPLVDRLKEFGFDPNNLWQMSPCGDGPYCTFTEVRADDKVKTVSIRGLERWHGYYESFKDEKGSCDAFVFTDGTKQGIKLNVLSSLEQKLLKESDEKDQVELSVFVHNDAIAEHTCDFPAHVLNVHFD